MLFFEDMKQENHEINGQLKRDGKLMYIHLTHACRKSIQCTIYKI